jgi:hypothetical protein
MYIFRLFSSMHSFVSDAVDGEMREVRLTGQRAEAGELGHLELDHVVALGSRVVEDVQVRGPVPTAAWLAWRVHPPRGPCSSLAGVVEGGRSAGAFLAMVNNSAVKGHDPAGGEAPMLSSSAGLYLSRIAAFTKQIKDLAGCLSFASAERPDRMRLNSIKLSGFKSFAEPTHFQLPGQLVGVVGPNGCGKSNIMDAVRWVLGESKASELRGESMQDVIFNGSGNRKPASRSSVELVFSNEDARARVGSGTSLPRSPSSAC